MEHGSFQSIIIPHRITDRRGILQCLRRMLDRMFIGTRVLCVSATRVGATHLGSQGRLRMPLHADSATELLVRVRRKFAMSTNRWTR